MKRSVWTILLLLAIVACESRGEEWRLRGGDLDVFIRGQNGEILVTDNRTGKTWRQPSQESTIVRPEAVKPVVAGDWEGLVKNGLKWRLDSKMTTKDGRTVTDDRDCSATAWIGWNPMGLLFQVDVQDDTFLPADLERTEWWHRDSVEFWVNDTQYAVRPVIGKSPLWIHDGGKEVDAQAETTVISGGYRIRVQFPMACQKGNNVRFAVGINDADSDNGRDGQLYNPIGWIHSQASAQAGRNACRNSRNASSAVGLKTATNCISPRRSSVATT